MLAVSVSLLENIALIYQSALQKAHREMSIKKPDTVQDIFIEYLITNQTYSSIYLKNNIRLKGCLIDHNDLCVILRNKKEGQTQLVYKNEISTIEPKPTFSNFEYRR